jgi:peptidyl-prolyl cis-trans isomerase C
MNFKTTTLTLSALALLTSPILSAKSRINLDSLPPLPGVPAAAPKKVIDIQEFIKELPEFYGEFAGKKLKTSEIMSEIQSILKRQRPGTTKEQTNQMIKRLVKSQLDKLAILDLAQHKEEVVPPTEKEIAGEKDRIAKRFGGIANFEKRLKKDGVTSDKLNQILRENLLITAYINSIKNEVKVSKEEIEVEYNNNRQRFTHEAKVKASHILLAVPRDASLKKEEEAKAKMEDILKQLKNGADFAELAKKESSCPSASHGGDLGFFTAKQMVKAFSDVAFSLKVGETSGIVKTNYGFHIIKVTDKKEKGITPLAEVEKSLSDQLKQRKVNTLIKNKIEENLKENKAQLLF